MGSRIMDNVIPHHTLFFAEVNKTITQCVHTGVDVTYCILVDKQTGIQQNGYVRSCMIDEFIRPDLPT